MAMSTFLDKIAVKAKKGEDVETSTWVRTPQLGKRRADENCHRSTEISNRCLLPGERMFSPPEFPYQSDISRRWGPWSYVGFWLMSTFNISASAAVTVTVSRLPNVSPAHFLSCRYSGVSRWAIESAECFGVLPIGMDTRLLTTGVGPQRLASIYLHHYWGNLGWFGCSGQRTVRGRLACRFPNDQSLRLGLVRLVLPLGPPYSTLVCMGESVNLPWLLTSSQGQ